MPLRPLGDLAVTASTDPSTFRSVAIAGSLFWAEINCAEKHKKIIEALNLPLLNARTSDAQVDNKLTERAK